MTIVKVIVYKTKHGSTKEVAEKINTILDDCSLMDIKQVDKNVLEQADTIILGTPIYFSKLDPEMTDFIKGNQDLLISHQCCLFVTGVMPTEIMKYINQALDSSFVENVKVISGVGGVLKFKELTISDKMILQVMNQHFSIMNNQDTNVFDNINHEEIQVFCDKVNHLA